MLRAWNGVWHINTQLMCHPVSLGFSGMCGHSYHLNPKIPDGGVWLRLWGLGARKSDLPHVVSHSDHNAKSTLGGEEVMLRGKDVKKGPRFLSESSSGKAGPENRDPWF